MLKAKWAKPIADLAHYTLLTHRAATTQRCDFQIETFRSRCVRPALLIARAIAMDHLELASMAGVAAKTLHRSFAHGSFANCV